MPETVSGLRMEGLWDWRTTGLKLKERIPDLDSGNIVPSDGAAGVDSEANRPTGERLNSG